MIQLNVLSGKTAGSQTVARRFPFRIGRAAQNDLLLDDDGVSHHFLLKWSAAPDPEQLSGLLNQRVCVFYTSPSTLIGQVARQRATDILISIPGRADFN